MSEIKQRWRLVFARGEAARFLSHLDAVRLWERAFRRGDIPVATTEGFSPRSKLVFAAPLQLGMVAEHELADVFLSERLAAPDLRARLAAGMPLGYSVVDLHDVWVGAPAIAPQLAAADYRLTLLNVKQDRLAAAAEGLLAAERLPRERHKEGRAINYDLRPLVLGLRVQDPDPAAIPSEIDAAAAAGVWMRLRHSQNEGSGRPDEVVAALAEVLVLSVSVPGADDEADEGPADASGATPSTRAGSSLATERPAAPEQALEAVRPVRERLWLADELSAVRP